MTVQLPQGGNIALAPFAPPDQPLIIGVGWDLGSAGSRPLDIDVSAFLVSANGKVRGDADFVFYNQPRSACGSVAYASAPSGSGDVWHVTIVPAQVPAGVAKVVITATIDDGVERGQSFGQLRSMAARLLTRDGEQVRYDVGLAGMRETALILVEVYRHAGGWKLRAIGQGYVGGLGPLAGHFGVDIAEGEPAPPPEPFSGQTIPATSGDPNSETILAPAPTPGVSGGAWPAVPAPGPAPIFGSAAPPVPVQKSGCARCGKPLGLLDRLGGNFTLCGACRKLKSEALNQFRAGFLALTNEHEVPDAGWQRLLAEVQAAGIAPDEALNFIRVDALKSLERLLAFHFADQKLTYDEEMQVRLLKDRYQLSDQAFAGIEQRIARLKDLTRILGGDLPIVRLARGARLEPGEVCHLQSRAAYLQTGERRPVPVAGEIIATNRRLVFSAPTSGFEMPWPAVSEIEQRPKSVVLVVPDQPGGGEYRVDDPEYVAAVLQTVRRLATRQGPAQLGADGRIPNDVKLAVWRRDGGKCAECGSDQDLELVHIIPVAKGGASTLANVQLLCHACHEKLGGQI